MLFRLLPFTALLVLTSCAYMYDGQIQEIYVETPGADNAVCHLYIEALKYKVTPPETIQVSKSREPMTVDCKAPGNRHQQQVIEPVIADATYANIANGILPGLAFDYASSSIYRYPDKVTVDFTYTPVRMEKLPAQNRPDVRQPEEYLLEETLPGQPRLNSDRYEQKLDVELRTVPPSASAGPYMIEETTTTTKDKGDLRKVDKAPASPPRESKIITEPKSIIPTVPVTPADTVPPPSSDNLTPMPSYPGQ